MAFTEIDPTTPAGTDKKKFGDDKIREFKEQVIENLQEVTNYPGSSVPALKNAIWTTDTRPTGDDLVDQISGYNTDLGCEEYYNLSTTTWIPKGAPKSHASTATTYGISSATNYGHAMASSATPLVAGTATAGTDNAKFAREGHVHPLQTTLGGYDVNAILNSSGGPYEFNNSNTDGWVRFRNGLLIQWGICYGANWRNFPVGFAWCYGVTGTLLTGGDSARTVTSAAVNSTSFCIWEHESDGGQSRSGDPIFFIAVGHS